MSRKRGIESYLISPVSPGGNALEQHQSSCSDDQPKTKRSLSFQSPGENSFQTRPLERDRPIRTNDEIHNSIVIDPVGKIFMDHPFFQRLKGLKQLGTAEQAYKNCNHTRFEHSMGVRQYAINLVESIRSKQGQALGVHPKDVLCVGLAGQLHDLGHGAFSHTFEDFVNGDRSWMQADPAIEAVYEEFPAVPDHWSHEDMSIRLIDCILESFGLSIDLNNLDMPLKQIGDGYDARALRVYLETPSEDMVLTSRDFVFIKELISGKPLRDVEQIIGISGFVGRKESHKMFLYDVVSNARSGLDVDKADYYARDESRALGNKVSPELRIIEEAVVAKVGVQYRICWPEKMAPQLLGFFKKRKLLHDTIYRHHASEAARLMVCDILQLADPYFRLSTEYDDDHHKSEYRSLPMSRSMIDPYAYIRLVDSVIDSIENMFECPGLAPARKLIRRLRARDLYKMAAEHTVIQEDERELALWIHVADHSSKDIEHEILRFSSGYNASHDSGKTTLQVGDIIVSLCHTHCGQKGENPLEKVDFVKDYAMSQACSATCPVDLPEAQPCDFRRYYSHMPLHFDTKKIRLFVRNPKKRELAYHIFHAWVDDQLRDIPEQSNVDSDEDTDFCTQPAILTQEP